MRIVTVQSRTVNRWCGIAQTAIVLFLYASTQSIAGEIEPRAYVNTPVGVNFLLGGYAYSKGDMSTPGASPIKDAQITTNSGVLAYARSLDVWGSSGKFDVIVPYTDLSGNALVSGQPRERQISGFNDPRARFSVNFYGAPALSLEEFASYRQDVLIGASVQVSAPFGQYDKSKLINIGSHRWFIKPDIGISKQWGDFTLELSTGVTFFTDNDAYYVGRNQQQDPLYNAQFHATYNFGRGLWGAVSGTLDQGGRTTVDGVQSDDRQNNSRLGVTLALPVNRNNSLKLYASTAISTTVGNDYNLYGIVWQYRWGGGL
jgi:hypothetical protein